MTETDLQLGRYQDPFVAFGRAVNLLRGVEPYASYRFGDFAATIAGQIERGHYVFVTRDTTALGYFGWARCTRDIAQAWVENRYVPSIDECRNGDTYVGMTLHTSSPEVFRFWFRETRKLFPDQQFLFSRQYVGGRRSRLGSMFNRAPR